MAYRKNARQEGRPPRRSSGGPPGKPPGGFGKNRPPRAASQGDGGPPRPNRPPGKPQRAAAQGAGEERLQKVLARAGLGSRRACEEYILQGRVTVDGKVVRELGSRVDPRRAAVAVDGEKIKLETMVYYAVNKPKGYVSTTDDPAGRPRVIDMLAEVPERVYTVGRLDEDSTGLMILTNDGELANRLAHPKFGVEKIYRAVVAGMPSREILAKLSEGIWLSDGKARVRRSRIVGMQGEATVLELVLAEGKNREIRRMLAKLGHKVMSLTRVAIGPIVLRGLLVGEHRELSATEVDMLRKVAAGVAISPPRYLEESRAFAPGRGRPNQGKPGPRSLRGDAARQRESRPPRPPGPRPPAPGGARYEGPGRPGPGAGPLPGRPPGPGGPRSQYDRRPPRAGQGQHPGPGGRPPMPGRRAQGPAGPIPPPPPSPPPGPGPISRVRKSGGGSSVPPPLGPPPSLRKPGAPRPHTPPPPTNDEAPPRAGRKIIGLEPRFSDRTPAAPSASKLRKRPEGKRRPPRGAHGIKRRKSEDEG